MASRTPSAAFSETVLEAAFEDTFVDTFHLLGWIGAHFRPAKTSQGWRTAVSGDGKGFPDWMLARERIVYAELKKVGGVLSLDQRTWRDRIVAAGGEWYCWTIEDWDEIVAVLRVVS